MLATCHREQVRPRKKALQLNVSDVTARGCMLFGGPNTDGRWPESTVEVTRIYSLRAIIASSTGSQQANCIESIYMKMCLLMTGQAPCLTTVLGSM